jgi:hypothetical protein
MSKGTHKETFFQPSEEFIPSHWVVFYWPEGKDPRVDFHQAAYFEKKSDAFDYEKNLL